MKNKMKQKKKEVIAKEQFLTPSIKHKKIKCRVSDNILKIWERETKFIDNLFSLLKSNSNTDEEEYLDDYLIDMSDSEESKKREKFIKKTKKILDGENEGLEVDGVKLENGDGKTTDNQPKSKLKKKNFNSKPTASRAELLERLHAKMTLVAQKKNSEKAQAKKEKKVAKKNERKKDSKKQFTSKINPNLKKSTNPSSIPVVKPEDVETEKTPLRKTVKKSNGQVVYSKFDFIAEEKHLKKSKPKVTELLKSAEKAEGKVARLEASGKQSAAVHVAETQKWMTAMKRAQGDKVKDDLTLLKKTIKKQKKLKETSKKKWTERVENVEKQKEIRQTKRLTNMQSRKDEKKKKLKKIQRKRGRVV